MSTDSMVDGDGVDAVVVTHNSAEDLQQLVTSPVTLEAFRRVVVTDNASTDDSRRIARDGGLDVFALPSNVGFAAAANAGAAETTSEIFAVLNADISLTCADDVERLLTHFRDPAVGAVAPALVLPDGTIQDSARRVPSPVDLVVRRLTSRKPDAVDAHTVDEAEWAVGACLLLRRSAFDAVGGFDERFFLYFEDVDLCVRLGAAGAQVVYEPSVRVLHRHRAASRAHLVSPATRMHIGSAVRFFGSHPRYIVPRRLRRRRETIGSTVPGA